VRIKPPLQREGKHRESTWHMHMSMGVCTWLQPPFHTVAGVLRLIDYGGAETFFRGDGLDKVRDY
tara:strand:+ start:40 stop:234 length:195 start_codon:yes stop_codon:yes gene_type:complete